MGIQRLLYCEHSKRSCVLLSMVYAGLSQDVWLGFLSSVGFRVERGAVSFDLDAFVERVEGGMVEGVATIRNPERSRVCAGIFGICISVSVSGYGFPTFELGGGGRGDV